MVVRQIIFEEQTGRLILSDSENNHYLCDIYGNKKIKFLPDISGVSNYTERINLMKNSLNKLEKPIDNYEINKHKLYLPQIRKFEGYSSFPNPLIPPFCNRNNYEISNTNKNKLLEILKKHFKNEKNLKLLNMKNENKGISYFSYAINPNDFSSNDRNDLLKLIDKHFEEYKLKNKYKLNLMPKDPIIKALKRFQKVLLENEDIKVINGRNLPNPSDDIKEKYKIINHHMKIKSLTRSNNNLLSDNMKMNINNQVQADMTESLNNIKISEENENYTKTEDNLSNLSLVSENELKYYNENINLNLKGTNFLKMSLDRELRHIEGFIEEQIKDTGILRKVIKKHFKSNGENYDENMALLRKVNPIAFEMRKRKEEYDNKQLLKKLSQKKIFQKNLLGF